MEFVRKKVGLLFSFGVWAMLATSVAYAQPDAIVQEILAINKAYANLDQVYVIGTIKYYPSRETNQPSETQTLQLYKMGKLSYQKLGKIEVIKNEKWIISIDHTNKIMAVVTQNEKQAAMPGTEVLTSLNEKSEKSDIQRGKNSTTLSWKKPFGSSYTFIALTYKNKNHLLEKIQMENTEREKGPLGWVDITYAYSNERCPKEWLLTETYITKNTKGKYVATNKFPGYQVYVTELK